MDYICQKHNISVLTYAVTPYQAGVYPKIDTLYETWRNVWAVEASSTSVLRDDARPVPHRRGFSFHGIKVSGDPADTTHRNNIEMQFRTTSRPNFNYISTLFQRQMPAGEDLVWFLSNPCICYLIII